MASKYPLALHPSKLEGKTYNKLALASQRTLNSKEASVDYLINQYRSANPRLDYRNIKVKAEKKLFGCLVRHIRLLLRKAHLAAW